LLKDDDSSRFSLWNASAYGQSNPIIVDEKFSFILPPGEFYVEVEKDGYEKSTSLIINLPNPSSINASILLVPIGNIFSRAVNIISTSTGANNFSLIITEVPETQLIENDELVNNIVMEDIDGNIFNMYALVEENKPTVLFVYSSWSTFAQEQINQLNSLIDQTNEQYQYLLISTMEPKNLSNSYLDRGLYGLSSYHPSDQFFDDYNIISLPQFIILDENLRFIGQVLGSHTNNDLIARFDEIISQ